MSQIMNVKYFIPYDPLSYETKYGQKFKTDAMIMGIIGGSLFLLSMIFTSNEWFFPTALIFSAILLLIGIPLAIIQYKTKKKIASTQRLFVLENDILLMRTSESFGVFYTESANDACWEKMFSIHKITHYKMSKQYIWVYGNIPYTNNFNGKITGRHVNKLQIPRIYDENILIPLLNSMIQK